MGVGVKGIGKLTLYERRVYEKTKYDFEGFVVIGKNEVQMFLQHSQLLKGFVHIQATRVRVMLDHFRNMPISSKGYKP